MPEPVRTCVGCREAAPKRALLRVVRDPSGAVAADPTGKAPGRGAYVHPSSECVRAAVHRGALARALRTRLDGEGAVRLTDDLERIVERLRASAGSTRVNGTNERQEGTG